MKTPILLTSLTLTLSSFVLDAVAINPAPEKMAKQLFSVLRQYSEEGASKLFPTLADFHQLMQQNSSLYGDFLPEAKEAFAKDYTNNLAPAFKQAFANMQQEALYKGIDWKAAQLAEIKEGESASHPVIIVFSSKGKKYELSIEKTIVVNGEWKPSQFMKLILKG